MSTAASPTVSTAIAKKPVSPIKSFLDFFRVDPVPVDVVADEAADLERWRKLLVRFYWQTIIIVVLGAFLVVFVPIAQPVNDYEALAPGGKLTPIISLTEPNMTNRTVLSWATVSITEVMTIGFGDFEKRLRDQKWRFTSQGWALFTKAFINSKIGQTFKQSQLVLTTVPSNTPVIIHQGNDNEEHVYQWIVQMPAIMTYATNNNVSRQEKSVIQLTIERVPTTQSTSGIAIRKWEALK